MPATATIALIACVALVAAFGSVDEDADAFLDLEVSLAPQKLLMSTSAPTPGEVLCSNTCKYSNDKSSTGVAV